MSSAPRTARISARKQPLQSRSNELVKAVLEAAVQVLASEGAHRFTTARVAEKAGVSVGSLYQYFPNKAAILFRLQSDEWRRTITLLRTILEDERQPPLVRLRSLVEAFVRSECEEAAIRVALADAAPLYRDAPEARAAKGEGEDIFRNFLKALLPPTRQEECAHAAALIAATLGSVGKQISETATGEDDALIRTHALADMLCAYVQSIARA